MNFNKENNIIKTVAILFLVACVSLGYYSEIIKDSVAESIEFSETFDFEKDKEEKETEKEDTEMDKLFSSLIDKFDFICANKDLFQTELGKDLPSHYLDNFTPPPERS